MQSEFDKEMDSLLREGARRGRATSATSFEWGARGREEDGLRATLSGAHLDADEQNAYAENSLPPSARTHYAAHLADCDDCRRSVTQLALAAGTPAQLEQRAAASGVEVLPNVSWRERIGALFAPRAWRYAVPALALLLVGAVALMVSMRSSRQGATSVAEQRNASDKTKIALPETHHAPQNNNAAAPVADDRDTLSTSNSNAPATSEEMAAAGGSREDQGQSKSVSILTDSVTAPPPPAPVTSGVGAASAPAPAAADIPTPLPTPAPVPEEVISTQEAEQKNKAAERTEGFAKDVQKPGNYEMNQSRERERISGPRRNNSEQSRNMQRGVNAGTLRDGADKNDAALATPTTTPPAAEARRSARQREADGERNARTSDDAKKSEGMPLPKSTTAETRNVAGRKFRRSGSAWIDTAYNSSQAVTVIRRNSEQYRALIADEPQLRRISDTLDGEITVVWKGRAYRIK
jgi:hypothetical protein